MHRCHLLMIYIDVLFLWDCYVTRHAKKDINNIQTKTIRFEGKEIKVKITGKSHNSNSG